MAAKRRLSSKQKVAHNRPGGSNAGEYIGLRPAEFAGPAGGAPRGTFPINTEARARAALSYARHAPNPSGIKRKVYAKAEREGWFHRPKRKKRS